MKSALKDNDEEVLILEIRQLSELPKVRETRN
jgi:hypothetical protein